MQCQERVQKSREFRWEGVKGVQLIGISWAEYLPRLKNNDLIIYVVNSMRSPKIQKITLFKISFMGEGREK